MAAWICIVCGVISDRELAFCLDCLTRYSFRLQMRRTNLPAPANERVRAITSAELVKEARTADRELPTGWRELFETWDGLAMAVLLFGVPGCGKTTLSLSALHRVFRSGIFLSAEEGVGGIMAARLKRLELISSKVWIVPSQEPQDAIRKAKEVQAEVVVVDSLGICHLTPEDIASVTKAGISLWIIAHEAKDGRSWIGPASIGHQVDTILHVVAVYDGNVQVNAEKNRFGKTGDLVLPL